MFSLVKKQLFILCILCLTQAHARELAFDEKVGLLESSCFNGEEILPDNYVEQIDDTCLKLALEINDDVQDAEEESASGDNNAGMPDALLGEVTCSGEDVLQTSEIEKLKLMAADATAQVKCTPQEVKKNQDSCENVWTCNSYRSINAAAETLLPEFVSKRISNGLAKKVKGDDELPSDCLDKGQGDCLTEVTTAFLSSFWSTMTSVWDVVKTGTSYLFSPSSWFDSKLDEAHAMSEKTDEDVKKLTEDPAGYFADMMSNMKKSLDTWIRSSVLCQEWEGTPHMSECKTPLASYECIDCNDKINATCAAVGAITSELGVMVFTAGAGNMVSIGAKVGAHTLRKLSQKVATKIQKVSPTMKSPAAVAAIKAESKIITSVKNVGGTASTAIARSAEILKKGKALSEKIIAHVEELKVVKATLAVGDFLSDPLRMSKRMSRMGVNTSNRILASAGSGAVARRSRIALAMDAKYDERRIVRQVIDKRDDHTKRNVAIRGTRTSQKVRSEYQHIAGHSNQNNKPKDVASSSTGVGSRDTKSRDSRFEDKAKRVEEKTTNNKQQDSLALDHGKSGQNQHNKGNDGQTNGSSNSSHHKKDENSNTNIDKLASLGKAAVATGIASKAVDVFGEEGRSAREKSEAKSKEVSSLKQAKEILGANSVQEMAQKAAALENVYNESNREQMVDRIAQESGVSRDVANSVYDQRVAEIKAAKEYVAQEGSLSENNSSQKLSAAQKNQAAEAELEKLFGKANNTKKTTVMENFEKKKGELEAKLAKLSNSLDDKESSKSQEVESVQNQSIATTSNTRKTQSRASASAKSVSSSGSISQGISSSVNSSSVGVIPTARQGNPVVNGQFEDENSPAFAVLKELQDNESIEANLKVGSKDDKPKNDYETVAVTNLFQLINKDGVELENDVSVHFANAVDVSDKDLSPDYIEAFNKFMESNDKAKLRIVKQIADGKLEVIEDNSGTQYSIISKANSMKLIRNEESRRMLNN
ncbi:hypothetical protein [Bacteriovorax sp. Seq25_V]|uniref:hypothetical protein n=1 Tax=Bacteriovorax sp. Seq25_V TaxID=1201288 RepID=UPI000389DF92|nr:hypothetical protein [Bacteriovorax sp. Seq25_V]EQC47980.1 hypothetical protein M900_A0082 [Bacteriovorax sp. Seq25_V]